MPDEMTGVRVDIDAHQNYRDLRRYFLGIRRHYRIFDGKLQYYKTKKNMLESHEIDYTIYGEEMQFVEIELDPYETVIAEAEDFTVISYAEHDNAAG